mmetsp:Transcript_54856/g.66040  ORF Transcript_54856/g.66040 Transcript_54856/m.66040 type:complete len:144 (+) Transcript_54856:7-438(+)
MCETKCSLTALCRLSITVGTTHEVLIDTLVKPAWPVIDHRTWVNGITKRHLSNVTFTLEHAQSFLGTLLSADTVVCGHAVINDLVALQVEHYNIALTGGLRLFHFKGRGADGIGRDGDAVHPRFCERCPRGDGLLYLLQGCRV